MTKESFTTPFKKIVNDHMPHLIANIEDIHISLYFDVLYEIVQHVEIEQYVINLVSELTKRVLSVKIIINFRKLCLR